MIKPMVFLLLLDFSGSMDQVVEQKPKIQILKTQVRGILEASDPAGQSEIVIFGSNPSQGCRDLKRVPGTSAQLAKDLMKQSVGPYGKTPLSEGLKVLTRRAIETDSKNIITVTDGGDSCGQDPCKTLVEMDALLGKKNKSVNLILVAFDIKQERAKFSCFKDLKLKNMTLKMVEAGNGPELMSELKEAQLQALGLGAQGGGGLQGENRAALPGSDSNSSRSAGPAGAQAGTSAGGGKPTKNNTKSSSGGAGRERPPENVAFLEMVGAPPEAQFELSGGDTRTWHGSYILQTVPGEYSLRFLDTFGMTLKVALAPEQFMKIPWAKLIGNRQTPVAIQRAAFELDWKPDEKTQKMHGELEKLKTPANLAESLSLNAEVPFGSYEVTVNSPDWLKGKLRGKKIEIARGQKISMDLKALFAEEVEWVENPHPSEMAVMEVTDKEGVMSRYLTSPGQKLLPVLKGSTVKFFDK